MTIIEILENGARWGRGHYQSFEKEGIYYCLTGALKEAYSSSHYPMAFWAMREIAVREGFQSISQFNDAQPYFNDLIKECALAGDLAASKHRERYGD